MFCWHGHQNHELKSPIGERFGQKSHACLANKRLAPTQMAHVQKKQKTDNRFGCRGKASDEENI